MVIVAAPNSDHLPAPGSETESGAPSAPATEVAATAYECVSLRLLLFGLISEVGICDLLTDEDGRASPRHLVELVLQHLEMLRRDLLREGDEDGALLQDNRLLGNEVHEGIVEAGRIREDNVSVTPILHREIGHVPLRELYSCSVRLPYLC